MNTVTLQTVKREKDGKYFSIGQAVYSLGQYIGIIDGMHQFSDDFRIHIEKTDEESEDVEYLSIFEVD